MVVCAVLECRTKCGRGLFRAPPLFMVYLYGMMGVLFMTTRMAFAEVDCSNAGIYSQKQIVRKNLMLAVKNSVLFKLSTLSLFFHGF